MDPHLSRALGEIKSGIKRRDHNRRKRTEGVVVKPRPKSVPTPRDPYSGFSPEQIEAANALKKRITGERDD